MSNKYFFTSESVTEGHPDKVCDQIADAILDEALKQDPNSRVACEVMVSTGFIIIAGEISGNIDIDYRKIAKDTVAEIGYVNTNGFNAESCGVLLSIDQQSSDIAMGVNQSLELKNNEKQKESETVSAIGAGDQGMMFGYADSETDSYMPMGISLAHQLTYQLAQVRKNKFPDILKPDGKAQVTIEYQDGNPVHIDTVVVSSQHDEKASLDQVKSIILEYVLDPILPKDLYDSKTKVLINPTGRFVIGGPQGDTGVTGRKIIVDTYGSYARNGGGALSGKDPTKVDRSANYAARYLAKNIVAAKLASKCELQISYAIGVAKPIAINVNTFGTGTISDDALSQLIQENFDLTPEGIINKLDLRKPIYKQIASYGHFGRENLNLSWEKLDLIEKFQSLEKAYLK
ncbi:MAG: methionine adenosyltransferase [Clostridiaceae bacterium]|nr:methionine adenosyltransferase [Clostridiaceae bacterium]